MRLQKHLEESYAQDIEFAKKRLTKLINNIENSINIMSKTKISDKEEALALEKIYKEIRQNIDNSKKTIKNSRT